MATDPKQIPVLAYEPPRRADFEVLLFWIWFHYIAGGFGTILAAFFAAIVVWYGGLSCGPLPPPRSEMIGSQIIFVIICGPIGILNLCSGWCMKRCHAWHLSVITAVCNCFYVFPIGFVFGLLEIIELRRKPTLALYGYVQPSGHM
jgi:hypothetical protein